VRSPASTTVLLSWIDEEDQLLAIANGKLYSIAERTEAGDERGEIRRTTSALYFTYDGKRVEVPPPSEAAERRLHDVFDRGALFSDTSGTGTNATTKLVLVNAAGVLEDPTLSLVRALEASEDDVFALADAHGEVALFSIAPDRGWGYATTRPWHAGKVPTDVAIFSARRIAVTVQRGVGSVLYLVERANLTYARALALPCVDAQIVAHDNRTLWVTGASPPPGPQRCDLFRVEPSTGTVTLVTAELDTTTLDVVPDALGGGMLLAADRAVCATTRGALRELVELGGGEEVTGLVNGPTSAVFIRGPRSSRIVLGNRRTVLPLKTPRYAPLFH
jgi:hypothetical protein